MILFLVNTFPSKDKPKSGYFNFRAVKQLSENNNILIIHLRAWHPKRKIIDRYEIEGLNVIVFSFPLFVNLSKHLIGLQFIIYSFFFKQLLKKQTKNIELIHSVGASFSGIVGSSLAKKMQIPHIAQCIGSDVNHTLPQLKNKIGIKDWNKSVSLFTCNSYALAKQVKSLYKDAKTKVIYRGVNINEFKFNSKKFESTEKLSFLFLGGLSDRNETLYGQNLKGGVSLLSAWKNIIEKNQNIAPKLELLFGGPSTSDEKIQVITDSNDITKFNIICINEIEKSEVVKLMETVHFVLIPSLSEGLPNIAMEAMATGSIVICSNVGGLPELISNNINGLMFSAGNEKELENLILKSIHSEDYNRISFEARKTIEFNFNSINFSLEYSKIYKNIFSNND